MSIYTIEKDFIDKVSGKVRLLADGRGRFRVLTPFQFDDGDQFVIVLKKIEDKWVLSDEAHTYLHLTYDIDENLLHSGTRRKLILKALSMFDVEESNGELILDVSDGRYGDALYDFVQALLKITDVSYLSKEQVRSTFMEDFRSLLHKKVTEPEKRMFFNWWHQEHDPQRIYKVDCLINGMPKPLFVYALANDSKARDTTIALHQFRKWKVPFRPLGIIKDSKAVSNNVLARFHDVCEEYFVDINESYASIAQYLEENTLVDVLPPKSIAS
jgi:hypothetical protein